MNQTNSVAAALGLTRKEAADWSLARLVAAAETDPHGLHAAPFERDCSNTIAERLGRVPRPGCVFVPLEVQQRVLQVGTATQGGNLVGITSEAAGASFATLLRGTDPLREFNIERIGPLTGTFAAPRETTAPTASWLTNESTNATEADPAFGTQTVAPKTAASFYRFPRQLRQSVPPATFDAMVIGASARSVAAAVAAAFTAGSGTGGQPTGIIGTGGVFNQSGTSIAFAGILNMIEAVEAAGLVDPSRAGFIIGTGAAKLLRTRERQAGAGSILQDGRIEGFKAVVTSTAPANAILFGAFDRAAIPEWGVLEIGVDPFTSFRSGISAVRAMYSVDVIVKQPSAFAKSESVT